MTVMPPHGRPKMKLYGSQRSGPHIGLEWPVGQIVSISVDSTKDLRQMAEQMAQLADQIDEAMAEKPLLDEVVSPVDRSEVEARR